MSSLSTSFDPGEFTSYDACSCTSTFLNPSLTPLQSIGGATIGGAYGMSPGLPGEVNTMLFIVCCGDVRPSHPLHLSPINICVKLGMLVSHQRDFSFYCTSFVTLGHSESEDEPPFLAIPHSLGLPLPLSVWTRHRYRLDWRRYWLRDISHFPIQAVVEEDVAVLSVHQSSSTESLFWMEKWDGEAVDMESAAFTQKLGAVYGLDGSDEGETESSASSTTCSSVCFTDSIEDLVGADWLVQERWASEIH